MDILIRPAELRDLDSLLGLLETLFAIESDFTFNAAAQEAGLRLLLESPKDLLLVADHDGEAIGMVSVQTLVSTAEGGKVGWVEDLVVAEPDRSGGIGARLLERVESWSVQQGLTRLQLLADRHNSAALEFYRRRGWMGTDLQALRKFPTPGPTGSVPEAQGSTVTPRQKAT
jgi:GNAT superfamily N-acetyltransferase